MRSYAHQRTMEGGRSPRFGTARPPAGRPSERLGNQARLRRLTSGAPNIQAKLAIGSVNDPLEHEADAVADRVMRMPAPDVGISSDAAGLRRKCAACEEDEGPLQRLAAGPQAAGAGDAAPPIVHDVIRSGGVPLDPATHDFMQSRFGRDFGDVRIHTGESAARSAEAVGARAYTVGRDVVFGAGQYQPQADSGRRLLAHELVHTVQQDAAGAPAAVSRQAMNSASPIAISVGVGAGLQREGECAAYSFKDCKGMPCVHSSKRAGFCGWPSIKQGCTCYAVDTPRLREFVQTVLLAALLAIGVIIAFEALAALVACFASGVCELGILVGALGLAGALLVARLLKETPDAPPIVASAAGSSSSEVAPADPAAAAAATSESTPSSSMETS